MNIKELNYDYDLVRDHKPLTGLGYWANVFTVIVIWISTFLQLVSFYKNGGVDFLVGVMIFFLIILTFSIWFVVRGMKPIGKEGKVSFLKIENGELIFKPLRFANERKIVLSQLEKIDVDEKRIIIKEKGRDELYINLKQIQNPAKRAEFIKMVEHLKF